jgi:hypothetical protein
MEMCVLADRDSDTDTDTEAHDIRSYRYRTRPRPQAVVFLPGLGLSVSGQRVCTRSIDCAINDQQATCWTL